MSTSIFKPSELYISGALIVIGMFISNTIFTPKLSNAYHAYEVQQTCDRSRTILGDDSGLETECGFLQDKYHVEYLCDSYAPDAYCWVEVK